MTVGRLYHATRQADLESILRDGLLAKCHGKVHGSMQYAPVGDSVYLSRMEHSNNLSCRLFDGGDSVVVLEIDGSTLDVDLIYPDGAIQLGC